MAVLDVQQNLSLPRPVLHLTTLKIVATKIFFLTANIFLVIKSEQFRNCFHLINLEAVKTVKIFERSYLIQAVSH